MEVPTPAEQSLVHPILQVFSLIVQVCDQVLWVNFTDGIVAEGEPCVEGAAREERFDFKSAF